MLNSTLSIISWLLSDCYSKREAEGCESENGTWFNQTCYNATYIMSFDVPGPVIDCNTTNTTDTATTTATLSGGISDLSDATCYDGTYNPLREYLDNVSQNLVSPSEEYFK